MGSQAKHVQGGAAKNFTELAFCVLTVGLLNVKPINGAKHVDPKAEC